MTEVTFWPITAESWSTLIANSVTIVGAISIVVVVQLNLRLIVYWQRRAANAAEAAAALQQPAYQAAPRPKEATLAILNAALDWAGAHTRYKDGLSPADLRALNPRQRQEYDLWVSRLLAAFDLVLLDVTASTASDMQATIKQEIAKHASILRGPWPLRLVRFPVSALLRGLIGEATSPPRASNPSAMTPEAG